MATNPAVSLPEADRVGGRRCRRCEFVVVSDTTRHTDTARHAHVLLPAAPPWGEKDGTVTNSERRISRSAPFLPLPGEAARTGGSSPKWRGRMGHADAFDYDGPAAIFREHAALSGFETMAADAFDIGRAGGDGRCRL